MQYAYHTAEAAATRPTPQRASGSAPSPAVPVAHTHTSSTTEPAPHHHTRTGSAFDDPSLLPGRPSPKASDPTHAAATDASNPQPFLKQRRLPSILLDSWEFRKLASEGSVLANAMVSYDVDEDGVEEVIVGTTEGLLCVVKPDCRAPLFLRVLAATISVVLYTPIRKRLVLITLEGQCEVIDYFLSSPKNAAQPGYARTPPAAGSGDGRADGAHGSFTGSSHVDAHHRSDSGTSLPRTGTSAGPSTGASPLGASNPLGMPRNTSHTSLMNPLLCEAASQAPTPPTHVFHVPSNCLCADLSTDVDTDRIFLGSYDRRFYVYSITTGSCLLSLFVHDPITSVKAFTIPTSAAQSSRKATASSSISVYDRNGRSGSSNRHSQSRANAVLKDEDVSLLREASGSDAAKFTAAKSDTSVNASTHTAEYRSPKSPMSSNLYVPLVFLSTPTHLILLPGGLNEIQQWRKLQPKSAHLPLTLQLHSDVPASTHSSQQQPSQTASSPTPAAGGGRNNSSGNGNAAVNDRGSSGGADRGAQSGGNSGGDASTRPTAVAVEGNNSSGRGGAGELSRSAMSRRPPRVAAGAREGETPVPMSTSASRQLRRAADAGSYASNNNHNSHNADGTTSMSRSLSLPLDRASTVDDNAHHTTTKTVGRSVSASATATRERAAAMTAEASAPLSSGQQRRLARKRAIQAAEMGRPVLVKPLWALHIGKHSLDVPPLQTAPAGPSRRSQLGSPTTTAATTTAAPLTSGPMAATARRGDTPNSVTGRRSRQPQPPTAAVAGSTHVRRDSDSLALEAGAGRASRARGMPSRGASTSLFSISSPSSVSGLRNHSDVFLERNSLAHSGNFGGAAGAAGTSVNGTGQAASGSAAQEEGRSLLHRKASRSGRDGGEDSEAAGSAADARRRPPLLLSSSVHDAARGNAMDCEEDANTAEAGVRAGDAAEGVRFSLPTRASETNFDSRAAAEEEVEDEGLEEAGAGAADTVDDGAYCEDSSLSGTDSYDSASSDSDTDLNSSGDDDDAARAYSNSSGDESDDGGRVHGGRSSRRRQQPSVDPALLAKSLARMRSESVPTMLLRRIQPSAEDVITTVTATATLTGANDNSTTHITNNGDGGGGAVEHTSLMDLALLDRKAPRGGTARRRSSRRQRRSNSTGYLHTDPSQLQDHLSDPYGHPLRGKSADHVGGAGVESGELGDVRLPTSVDVSVGASQVAVALCCEDGLAIELRFTVAKLSSLSRRARRRASRTTRLYDLRHPPCPKAILRRQRRREWEGARRGSGRSLSRHGDEAAWRRSLALLQQQPQHQSKPASSPSSPTHARSFSKLNSVSGSGGGLHRSAYAMRKSAHRPKSTIFLPFPTPGPTLPSVNASSTSHVSLSGAQRTHVSNTNNANNNSNNSVTVPGSGELTGFTSGNNSRSASSPIGTLSPSGGSVNVMVDDVGNRTSTAQQQQQQQQHQHQQRLRGSLRTPSPTSPLLGNSGSASDVWRSRRYEEDAIVLRAQCLWAARLGDSPLVQRARVFCVKDSSQDNIFCTVFVAANGTCFAIDGNTLSVVECCVKEDCSSFTLMAGASSTMPLPLCEAAAGLLTTPSSSAYGSTFTITNTNTCNNTSSTGEGNGGEGAEGNTSAKAAAAASTAVKPGVNVNLLRGAVGRTVSCVCVSVDELCIYSVGEANQLVQHRDAPNITAQSPTGSTEQISLLSRRFPAPQCAATAASKLSGYASGGEFMSHQASQLSNWDDSVDERAAVAEMEEKALLRLLAQRLREQAAYDESHGGSGVGKDKADGDDSGDGVRNGGEEEEEEDEEALLQRMKRMLLYGYSEAEWEKMKLLDDTVT